MVPSTSEDRSEAEVLHDPHDYDEVPVEEMASRPPMPVPAPSDVYSEVKGERVRGERVRGEKGREGVGGGKGGRKLHMCIICFVYYHNCVNDYLSLRPSLPLVKVYSKLEARDSPKLYSEPQEHHGQSIPGKSDGVVREKRRTSAQNRSSEYRLTQVLVRE